MAAEPDWNPDTGGRSLAEILKEAGIESAARANRRRRWDDPDEAGLRQRRAEAASAGRSEYGRRRSDHAPEEPRPSAERSSAERSSAERSSTDRRAADRRATDRRPAADPWEMRRPADEPREARRPVPDPSTAAIPGLRPDRKPGVPVVGTLPSGPVQERPAPEPAAQRSPSRPARRPADPDPHPSTGPIPVVRADGADALDEDPETTPRESALAWLRFAGELVIALAAGVGVYFLATLLWDNAPYLAVLLSPVAVAGLVAGVGFYRQRQNREPIGAPLLAVLVFAGVLLTVVPAAGLLSTGS
jgi:hypothetical protein